MAKTAAQKAVRKKKRYDGDLTPEELAQAIAMFRAQQETAVVDEEEAKPDAAEVVSAVKDRKDRRDSETEQMDYDAVIAEQESDIEALLDVIDELQAASDMVSADADDTPEDAGISQDSVGEDEESCLDEDGPDENTDGEDPGEKALNNDSVDRIVNRRVRDYLEVCRIADRLNLDGVENLDLTSARKKVIRKVNPKLNLDGKSDTYIRAAFDIAKQGVSGRKKTDDQRRSMMGGAGRVQNTDSADNGSVDTSSAAASRRKMIARMKGEK